MDGDHRILALNQIWVWTPSRAPEMGAEGQIQLVQGSKTSCSCSQVAYGSHLLKDLFLHLHPSPLSGVERAEPLELPLLQQQLLPSCLPLKCQYLQPCSMPLQGPDATQAGSTPANPTLKRAATWPGCNENKLPCQRGGQLRS